MPHMPRVSSAPRRPKKRLIWSVTLCDERVGDALGLVIEGIGKAGGQLGRRECHETVHDKSQQLLGSQELRVGRAHIRLVASSGNMSHHGGDPPVRSGGVHRKRTLCWSEDSRIARAFTRRPAARPGRGTRGGSH